MLKTRAHICQRGEVSHWCFITQNIKYSSKVLSPFRYYGRENANTSLPAAIATY